MEMLTQVVEFAAKGFIVFLVIGASAIVLLSLGRRRRAGSGHIEVRKLNLRYEALADSVRAATMGRKSFKAMMKGRPKTDEPKALRSKVYVFDFEGDLLATAVEKLREEITAVAGVATAEDEIVVRIESPGGGVPHYGLAAAQLQRLRERKLKVTAIVDRIAASGGYMMACVADRIVAAPFSIIGSIGVVGNVPNVHRLLKKHDVDFHEVTAGEFKRTLTVFGEPTDKGMKKFQEQLDETHVLFKDFVKQNRPTLDIDKVATGEFWLGTRAKELGLVDRLSTSDDYLLERAQDADIYRVAYKPERPWRERLGRAVIELADAAVLRVLSRLSSLEIR
jgi:serine protease SohB